MEELQNWIDQVTTPATNWLNGLNDWLYTSIMIVALCGTGLWLTIVTRGVQFRHIKNMVKGLTSSRKGARGGISSFQAFAIGMATRIGIGNITGVALAIILGGPGALFWMWLVALLGMATAFSEATLAQIYKKQHHDGAFRGGPATYILRGLKLRPLAISFAVCMVFAMAIAMPMVQANTIAGVLYESHGVPAWITGVIVAICTGLVLLGGVRGVAKATEIISPLMAFFYIAIAVAVVVANIDQLPRFFQDVFDSAFGLREAVAGTSGGIIAALLNGLRRGLFSNEAGMGTSPNAAATATVAHPVQQGFIQSLGVFLDTWFICTATGFIVVTSGVLDLTKVGPEDAGHLTTTAIVNTLGDWMAWPVAIMIFFFGYSSIIGAYAYGEANLVFMKASWKVHATARACCALFSAIGAMLALTFVWALMDLAMFIVTIFNLVALVALTSSVVSALRDFERQSNEIKKNGSVLGDDGVRYLEPVFAPEKAGFQQDVAKVWAEAGKSAAKA